MFGIVSECVTFLWGRFLLGVYYGNLSCSQKVNRKTEVCVDVNILKLLLNKCMRTTHGRQPAVLQVNLLGGNCSSSSFSAAPCKLNMCVRVCARAASMWSLTFRGFSGHVVQASVLRPGPQAHLEHTRRAAIRLLRSRAAETVSRLRKSRRHAHA